MAAALAADRELLVDVAAVRSDLAEIRRVVNPQREALDEALAEYVEVMEYSLDFSFAGLNLGNLYSALGEPSKAERFYRAGLDPDVIAAQAALALVVVQPELPALQLFLENSVLLDDVSLMAVHQAAKVRRRIVGSFIMGGE